MYFCLIADWLSRCGCFCDDWLGRKIEHRDVSHQQTVNKLVWGSLFHSDTLMLRDFYFENTIEVKFAIWRENLYEST